MNCLMSWEGRGDIKNWSNYYLTKIFIETYAADVL